MRIGVMGAMPQEIDACCSLLNEVKEQTYANRCYFEGFFGQTEVVVVHSKCGKVNAAQTVTTLIERFKVDAIVFTGLAGGAGVAQIGDTVLASACIHHDMDATPLFPRYEIPLTGMQSFAVPNERLNCAKSILQKTLIDVDIHQGLIATGDQFIKDASYIELLINEFPELLAIEMEGAALAQIAHDYQLPYLIVRTISDKADLDAPQNFGQFLEQVVTPRSVSLVQALLKDQSWIF